MLRRKSVAGIEPRQLHKMPSKTPGEYDPDWLDFLIAMYEGLWSKSFPRIK